MTIRHFLALHDLSRDEARSIVQRGKELRHVRERRKPWASLQGRTMAMIFEKSSTRTRVSFEAGMAQLGGSAIFLPPRDSQIGRGEPVEDTARVVSRMVDLIVIRANSHEMVERFSQHSAVPVINALTDLHHPCQLLADIMTWAQHHGDIGGRTAAWIGDGNNVCHSWIEASALFGFQLRVATPEGYGPSPEILARSGRQVTLTHDPREAAQGAHVLVTDTWASMGQEDEKDARLRAFRGFQVDSALMSRAATDALFMHCLPAYRDYEVSAEVMDGPQSVVWEEAENRLHATKALLEFLLLGH